MLTVYKKGLAKKTFSGGLRDDPGEQHQEIFERIMLELGREPRFSKVLRVALRIVLTNDSMTGLGE